MKIPLKKCLLTHYRGCESSRSEPQNEQLNKPKHQIIFIFKIHNGQVVGCEETCWNTPGAERHGAKQWKERSFVPCHVEGRKEPDHKIMKIHESMTHGANEKHETEEKHLPSSNVFKIPLLIVIKSDLQNHP